MLLMVCSIMKAIWKLPSIALILPTLMNMFSPEESNLSTEGHVLFAHYQQGMTNYLAIVLYHHSEGVAMAGELDVPPRGTST